MSRHSSASHFHKSKTLNDKYLLGDEIGKGAYGRVYKGLDLENGDFVAIKQVSLENIPSEDLASIMQEIDLLKNLNHKNIVKYQGSFKTKTHLYIILEYVENGSLANIIKPNKFGAFPESLVAVYIAQVLEGLVYLHEQGVIHRDIKGANILTTKEGLVKLADFGVATKLTEADVNTHSVVGTPYWMAPEVIEMSGVSAASDIWSVGCTVIELLTCVPPYYDLQPMPALFRIVQDDHPPIPEHVSAAITDFLHQCFRKDAKLRPDARTLLKHSWIRNTRRSLQSSLERTGGRINNIPQDVSTVVERTIEDGEKEYPRPTSEEASTQGEDSGSDEEQKTLSPSQEFEIITSGCREDNSRSQHAQIKDPGYVSGLHQVAISNGECQPSSSSVMLPLASNSVLRLNSNNKDADAVEGVEMKKRSNVLLQGASVLDLTDRDEDDEELNHGSEVFGLGLKQRKNSQLARSQYNASYHPPKLDGQVVDPFVALANSLTDVVEASSQGVVVQGTVMKGTAKSPLLETGGSSRSTARPRSKMAQKGSDNTTCPDRKEIVESITDVVEDDDSMESTNLGFGSKDEGRDFLAKQAMEITRLVSLLKPDESEKAVVSTCQKLVAIFQEYPEQKAHLISQHGMIPLVEMLDVNNSRVLHAVLQLLNQIIRDNVDFQENACLVGLIPMIMNFASPERSREMRLQAATFIHQICVTSSVTMQMFIACRGLPVLVSFLEPDYTKYREMAHLAIDAMWQVFDLQNTKMRNDFCRIFAKSGVLVRLVNTLYSLNEAVRGASVGGIGSSGGSPLSTPSGAQLLLRTWSGPLEQSRSTKVESFKPRSGQLDPARVRAGYMEHHRQVTGLMESSRSKSPQSHKSAGLPEYLRHLPGQPDQGRSSLIHLEGARVLANSEGAHEIPLESAGRSFQPSGDRDLAIGPIDSPRLEIEHNRSLHGGTEICRVPVSDNLRHNPRSANGFVEPGHQDVQPLLTLLEKEPPSRSGQAEYYRNVSSANFERPDASLPLLHHAAALRKVNGKLDGLVTGGQSSNMFPNPSGYILSHAVGAPCNHSDVPPSSFGSVSQKDPGALSATGVTDVRAVSISSLGSTLNAEVTRDYVAKVADLLLEFSRADTVVKSHMCSLNLLIRLFQMLNKLAPVILVKVLKCIKELSTDPFTLESLQRADAMKHLVPFLEVREGPYVSQIHNQVLNALFNLCKINKRRQEQAAESGVIPHLMYFIRVDSPLKQFALPLLCDMAHASTKTRGELRAHKGLEVYLSLLNDTLWAVTALDSLAVCLAHDNEQRKVEQTLLSKDALQKLVAFFQSSSGPPFVHILEPFLKIITKSVRLNTALAVSGLTPLLVSRLDHQDAIARLNLLKLIKAVYEHHPRPKQLIVEHDLPAKLRKLIEERRDGERSGGQVLVKQMATSLLKALHINTVL